MTHNFNLADDCLLALTGLGKHFVVVASNEQVGDGVACSDLDLAVVTSKDETVCRLHHGH